MICNNCGTNNPDGVKNCSNCGKDLEVEHTTNMSAPKYFNPFKALTITLASIFGGIFCFLCLPWVLLFFGIMFSSNPPAPVITHGEFPFHLVYEVNGQQYTIDDTIICNHAGMGANEGRGKYLEWKERLANGNTITRSSSISTHHYGIKLFDGVIEGQGSTSIICDIGNPEYYLGYNKYTDYSPGLIRISSPTGNGVISEDELWNEYKIKIIEEKFSDPMEGNGILVPSDYKDVTQLALSGVTAVPQESSYSPGTKEIVFTWKNDTDKQLTCKESFYIQKKINDKWQDIYRQKKVHFSEEKMSLDPGTQILHTYDISKYTNNITAGNYRVVSSVLVPVNEKTYKSHVLCGEFTIN